MAKYQYRLSGELEWMSNSGNAIAAVFNPPGSGKKLTIRSFEATNLTSTNTGTAGTVSAGTVRSLALVRATVGGGDPVTPVPLDSDGSWPATVTVTVGATVASPSAALSRHPLLKQMNQASLSWLAMPQNAAPRWTALKRGPKRGGTSPVEQVVIRAGESVALYPDNGVNSVPLRVTATLTRQGTPNRAFAVTTFAHVRQIGQAILAVSNTAGSGEIVTISEIQVEEVGTYDSPYFQLVPMGPMDVTAYTDPGKAVPLLKMDTAYPSPTSWVKALKDVPFLPLGLPENALSDGGSGSPKGFNYLKSKDFLGPVYRAYFPEHVGHDLRALLPDALGIHTTHKYTDLFFRRAGITLREGEGLALVSGAETAVSASAVGVSGWSIWHVAANIDVEPSFAPTLTLTGLKTGTEVRIFPTGSTTELAGAENITSGSFSWVFDASEVSGVDITIMALGYQYMRLPLTLANADTTVPIQQVIDRQYANG